MKPDIKYLTQNGNALYCAHEIHSFLLIFCITCLMYIEAGSRAEYLWCNGPSTTFSDGNMGTDHRGKGACRTRVQPTGQCHGNLCEYGNAEIHPLETARRHPDAFWPQYWQWGFVCIYRYVSLSTNPYRHVVTEIQLRKTGILAEVDIVWVWPPEADRVTLSGRLLLNPKNKTPHGAGFLFM